MNHPDRPRRDFLTALAAVGVSMASPARKSFAESPTRDRNDAARRVLQGHVDRGYATGAVALIGRGGHAEVLTVGVMALNTSLAMKRDTIFRIASLTKPITAAAVMMLIEDGKLRLDDLVERWLPELANRRVLKKIDGALEETVPASRSITVEDLLSFRFGLGVLLAPPDTMPIQREITRLALVGFGIPDPTSPLGFDEWMKRVGQLPLMAQPGTDWLYTTGSAIQGVLVARVSGQSFPAFLEERIFKPLQMKDTAFFVPPAKRARLATQYKPGAHGLELFDDAVHTRWSEPPAFPAGDGGLVSTVDDYFAFSRCILQRGRVGAGRLLAESSVAAMTTNHLTPKQVTQGAPILGPGRGWGYGMSVLVDESPECVRRGSYGWNGGLGTTWLADPGTGTTAILMTQTLLDSPELPAIHRDFWRAVFDAG